MRLTAFLLFIISMQVSARGFSQTITFKAKSISLTNMFKEIRKQTGYNVLWSVDNLQKARTIDVDFKDTPLKEVMEKCLANQSLSYEIEKKTILIKYQDKSIIKRIKDLLDVPKNLRGQVTDSLGKPVEGVSIINPQKTLSTVSNSKGEFLIKADAGDNIILSCIGFKSFSFIVTEGMSFQSIVLHHSLYVMKEVTVTTGYQTVSRERATGSFAKPDMQVFQDRTGTVSIMNRLEGLIPGLTIIPGPRVLNSRNGSQTGQQAILRGISSIQLNPDPLYVVNGIDVPDISTLNPDDVEDITVLKDAAASAIWGSRAANGVVVITTKTGGKSNKIKVTYSGFYNFQGKPDLNYLPVLNSKEYIEVARQIFDPVAYPWNSVQTSFIAPHELILYNQYRGLISAAQANASLESLSNIDNHGQIKDLLYRNASVSNHTISISGGTNLYSIYSSFSYNNNTGNTPGEANNVYRINLNQEYHPNKSIGISLSTILSNTISSNKRAVSVDYNFLPYQMFKDDKGNGLNMNYVQGYYADSLRASYQKRSGINLDYNPLNELNYGQTNTNDLNININMGTTVKLFKGLSFIGKYGYLKDAINSTSYDDSQEFKLRNQLLSFTVAPGSGVPPVYYLPSTGGTYSTGNSRQQSYTVRNQFAYDYSDESGDNTFGLQGGQNISEQKLITNSTTVLGYDRELETYAPLNYKTLSSPVPNTVIYNYGYNTSPLLITEDIQRIVSYFGLANYAFKHKYSIDGSWRIDHSNLFGKDHATQNKPVWSIGGKWALWRENFMKRLTWVNDLAIRATYGITGNAPYPGASATFDILFPGNPGTIAGNSLTVSTPANNTLVWESTQTKNFGTDFSILQRRISASIDVYFKKTSNLLGPITLNPLTGFNGTTGNLGGMTNKGLEINLRTINVQNKTFTWTSNLTFSYNKNKLVSYSPLSVFANSASSKVGSNYYIGFSTQSLFAYRYTGLDNLGDPQIRLANGEVTKVPNAAKPEDVIYKGTIIPVINGGFTNVFSYKSISLTANMIYSLGNVMRRDVDNFYTYRLTGSSGSFNGNINSAFLNRWQKPGDEKTTDIPSYVASQDISYSRRDVNYYTYADINVVSAAYIKLRDITLSWIAPEKSLKIVGITAARFFIQTTNFMIWKANKYGIDPEYINYQTGQLRTPPYKHSISIGTNITF